MPKLFAAGALALVAFVLSGCQTYPDPGGNAFLYCDNRAEACYRSCESRVDEDAYARCQDSCGFDADRCFQTANAEQRYASTYSVVNPWYGRYGAWYPTNGYFFSVDIYNRYGLRRAYRPARIAPSRRFVTPGYGPPRRVVRPYRDRGVYGRPVRPYRDQRPVYRDQRPGRGAAAPPRGGGWDRGPDRRQDRDWDRGDQRGSAGRRPQGRPSEGRRPEGRPPEGRRPDARPQPQERAPQAPPQERQRPESDDRPINGRGRGDNRPPREGGREEP